MCILHCTGSFFLVLGLAHGTAHSSCRPLKQLALLQITSVLNDTVDAYLGGKTGTFMADGQFPGGHCTAA